MARFCNFIRSCRWHVGVSQCYVWFSQFTCYVWVSHVCHKYNRFHFRKDWKLPFGLQKFRNCNFIAFVLHQYKLHKHGPFGFLTAQNMAPIQRWQGFTAVIDTRYIILYNKLPLFYVAYNEQLGLYGGEGGRYIHHLVSSSTFPLNLHQIKDWRPRRLTELESGFWFCICFLNCGCAPIINVAIWYQALD